MTAVEWLVEQINKHWDNEDVNSDELIKQAKEMERNQIIDAYKRESVYMYHAGCSDEQINKSADKYYNETYKQDI